MKDVTIESECARKGEYNEYYNGDFEIIALCVDGIVSYRENEEGYYTVTNRRMFEIFHDAGDHDCERRACSHPMRKFEPGVVWFDVMNITGKTARRIKSERRIQWEKRATMKEQGAPPK